MSNLRGRALSCRKCLAHGKKVSLKGHSPICPYLHCTCKHCIRLQKRRTAAFVRRHREVLSKIDEDFAIDTVQDLRSGVRPKWRIVSKTQSSDSDEDTSQELEENEKEIEKDDTHLSKAPAVELLDLNSLSLTVPQTEISSSINSTTTSIVNFSNFSTPTASTTSPMAAQFLSQLTPQQLMASPEDILKLFDRSQAPMISEEKDSLKRPLPAASFNQQFEPAAKRHLPSPIQMQNAMPMLTQSQQNAFMQQQQVLAYQQAMQSQIQAQAQAQAHQQAAAQAAAVARLNPGLTSGQAPSAISNPAATVSMAFSPRPTPEMLTAQAQAHQQMQNNMAQIHAQFMEKSRLQQQAPPALVPPQQVANGGMRSPMEMYRQTAPQLTIPPEYMQQFMRMHQAAAVSAASMPTQMPPTVTATPANGRRQTIGSIVPLQMQQAVPRMHRPSPHVPQAPSVSNVNVSPLQQQQQVIHAALLAAHQHQQATNQAKQQQQQVVSVPPQSVVTSIAGVPHPGHPHQIPSHHLLFPNPMPMLPTAISPLNAGHPMPVIRSPVATFPNSSPHLVNEGPEGPIFQAFLEAIRATEAQLAKISSENLKKSAMISIATPLSTEAVVSSSSSSPKSAVSTKNS